jgi:hypothetical protein
MGGYFTAQGLQITAASERSVGVGPFVISCSDEPFIATYMPPAGVSQIGNPPTANGLWIIPDTSNDVTITMLGSYYNFVDQIQYVPAFEISKNTPSYFAFPTADFQTPGPPDPIMYFSCSTAFTTMLTFQWT